MRLVASIAHAAHRPERAATCERMHAALCQGDIAVHVEAAPGRPHEWSERQWRGAIGAAEGREATHALLLNDDMVPCDSFLAALDRVVAARPNHIINLYNTHPLAREAQKRGLSWLTSPDGLIGNAYVLPVPALRAFLEWRAAELEPGTVEGLSEDQLLNLWAMATGAIIWHTVPALVQHDTSVPSCYGNTQMRRALVGPRADMLAVDWDTDALHTGRIFAGNHHALLTRVRGDRLARVRRFYELAGDEPR